MTAFPKYPAYKDSGVEWLGEVPEHWEVERLKGSLSEIDVRSTTGTETLLSLRMNVGLVPHNEVSTLPITNAQLVGYKKVSPGQVVMNRMRASSGIFAVATTHGLVSPDYAVFEPKGKQGTDYLLSLFKTGPMMTEFRRYSTGLGTGESGFLRLYSNFFFNIRCPIPPKEEETRIVAFLDEKTAQIDALIEKKQRQIELLDEQKAILINRAVTRGLNPKAELQDSGIPWIGPIPKRWAVKRMRYLCHIGTGECDTKDSVPNGEYPFFVRSQTPERINSFAYDCEAILTAGDGAGVGKVFHHFTGKFDCHQRVYVLRNFQYVAGRFLYFYMRDSFHRVALTGEAKSTVDSLRRPMLTDFLVPLPSLDEQHQVVSRCDEVEQRCDELVAKVESQIQTLQTLRSTLIAHAVTGKIKI